MLLLLWLARLSGWAGVDEPKLNAADAHRSIHIFRFYSHADRRVSLDHASYEQNSTRTRQIRYETKWLCFCSSVDWLC